MNTLSIKPSALDITLKITFAVILIYLGYKALNYGIQGLGYFKNNPNTVTHPFVLLTHIGTGFIALVLGPLQFFKGLRNRFVKLHRLMGKTYLLAILLSGTFGLGIGINKLFFLQQLVFGSGIIVLALAWLFTGFTAYWFIRDGQVKKHQEWMIRNYVLTFAFVTYRIGLEWLMNLGFSFEETGIMAWLCWVPQLMVVDYWLQLRNQKMANSDTYAKIKA
ncbi:DUF2306 domain-containing protein [Pleomorphovibrio marinus]|uniref:DUF2306 domain-containing protein n=1 Tax=Pleomorphovibrio marinus TaxID=2164132 RepID=UPI000E0C3652|nr:DUF2306 domain-containing protein [Pleomorphovibrio marinus]